MRASIIISALVAVLVGFGGSVAIILAAAKAVGATPDQTSSWVAAMETAVTTKDRAASATGIARDFMKSRFY